MSAQAARQCLAGPVDVAILAAMLKDLLRRAHEVAHKHLPDQVLEGSRRVVDAVLEHAPRVVQDAVTPLLPRTDLTVAAPADAAVDDEASALDFRDTQRRVVLFGFPEDPATNRVAALLTGQGVTFRRQDLHQQPREAQQIAHLTGVMVPPYVYIHGRFWGGEGEMDSLCALGELQKVIDNDLDALSDEARRIGKLRPTFADTLSPDNILLRLRLGHILCVDGLDCWYESGPTPGFFYEGAPRPVADMPAVAQEIAQRAEASDLEARWLFEPSVSV